jgi:Paraquat-inducible protein A
LLILVGYFGYEVHDLSMRQKTIKKDYSIANSISYGLLSVNKWRDLVVGTVRSKITNFTLTKAEQDSLEKEVEGVLNALITKGDSLMNAPQKSVGGKLRRLAFHTFVNEDKLRQSVPGFSKKIVAQLMKPSSKRKLAYVAKNELEDLGQATYDSAKQAQQSVDSIYQKYQVDNADAFDKKTKTTLSLLRQRMYGYVAAMFAGVFILLLIWFLLRRKPDLFAPLYAMSILFALILLLTGLTSTMIEIDARIESLDFHLIGSSISFKNQVLFFQSKSIVDVVALLIRTGKYDSILVGILILCFSIFFPVTKLLSAGVYLLGENKWKENKFIRYFAFHSGKWSMADVMVVAIFMAYIGFNGILNDQMASLDLRSGGFTSIATNNTSLQPGYIVFVGFVLLGLLLSQILKWITQSPSTKSSPS